MMIGISINKSNVDRRKNNYDFYTLENALKFNAVHQNDGYLDWSIADELINKLGNSENIRGHIQISHQSVNKQVSSAFLKNFLIETIKRYPKINKWDIVGEAISDVGLIRNYWSLTEFKIEDIVAWAKKANPNNIYYYSDYNLKASHKWKKAIELCNDLELGLSIQFRHHRHGRVWLMNLSKWLKEIKTSIDSNVALSELEILCNDPVIKKQCEQRVIKAANSANIDVCIWG